MGQFLSNRCKNFSGAVPLTVAGFVMIGAVPFYWVVNSEYDCAVNMNTCLNETDPYSEGVVDEDIESYCVSKGYVDCTTGTWVIMILVMFFSGLMLGVQNANVRAMLLNVNLPEVRGTSMTLLVVVSNLGKGIGPILASKMIQGLGRTTAFNIATGFFSLSSNSFVSSL